MMIEQKIVGNKIINLGDKIEEFHDVYGFQEIGVITKVTKTYAIATFKNKEVKISIKNSIFEDMLTLVKENKYSMFNYSIVKN